MWKKSLLFLMCLALSGMAGAADANPQSESLTIMQLNIWQDGTKVPGGKQGIVDEIARLKPQIVLLSECGISKDLSEELAKRGLIYHRAKNGDGVLSTFPLTADQAMPYCLRAELDGGKWGKIVVYSMHLYFMGYACYLPRGYDGNTWQKMPERTSNVQALIEMNASSGRPEVAKKIAKDAEPFLEAGNLVFLGGDFNEPSHLDWIEATKDLTDHNGIVMEWQTSKNLADAGWLDAYRLAYPDPVTHPGFTFPADNPAADVKILAWAPESDERDRIDFIFTHQRNPLQLIEAGLIGPETMIERGKRGKEPATGKLLKPVATWPSDHRGTFATFRKIAE